MTLDTTMVKAAWMQEPVPTASSSYVHSRANDPCGMDRDTSADPAAVGVQQYSSCIATVDLLARDCHECHLNMWSSDREWSD